MTHSQKKNTVKNVRMRSKKCGRPEKTKEKMKFNTVDEDDAGPSVKTEKEKD